MANNKVIFGNNVLIDLTEDTVTADKLALGFTAHSASGEQIVGTMASGGYIIRITTPDSELYGETITISKNDVIIGTTEFDNQGIAEYTVSETGTYTIAVTYDGKTSSTEVVVTDTEAELRGVLNYQDWLTAGGLDPTQYESLNAVLNDEKAVRRLMTVHDSVDYLCSFF